MARKLNFNSIYNKGDIMKKKNESHHSGSYMVRRNLHSIRKFADMLMQMIDENDEIESWMEHKISVAKAAMSDVKDAFMYDQEEHGGEHHHDDDDDQGHPHLKIAILKKAEPVQDDFGLNKMMGGCGGANESRGFLGSAAINENRQIVSHNLKKKIFAESVEKFGNLVRITTKRGETYEYVPYLGTDVEMLRCEQYGVKINGINEMAFGPESSDVMTVIEDKMGRLHVWKGEQELVQHDKFLWTTKAGKKPDFTVSNSNDVVSVLNHLNPSDKGHVESGYKLVTHEIPLDAVQGHEPE